MAIGNPTQVGIHAYTNLAITTANTDATCVIPANSLVVIGVHISNTTTDPGVPTSVTDGTNTATVADASFWTSPIGRVSLFSWFDTAGRTATVTANFASSNATTFYVWTMSSAATASWTDQTQANGAAGTTALGITTAGNVAQADEVAIAMFCRGSNIAAPTTFPIAGYTSLASVTNATRTVGVLAEYKNGLTAGAAETSGGTLSASANVARIIVTYKGLVAATTTPEIAMGLTVT